MVAQVKNLAAYYKHETLIIMKQLLDPFLKIYFDLLSFNSVSKSFHNCDPLNVFENLP